MKPLYSINFAELIINIIKTALSYQSHSIQITNCQCRPVDCLEAREISFHHFSEFFDVKQVCWSSRIFQLLQNAYHVLQHHIINITATFHTATGRSTSTSNVICKSQIYKALLSRKDVNETRLARDSKKILDLENYISPHREFRESELGAVKSLLFSSESWSMVYDHLQSVDTH